MLVKLKHSEKDNEWLMIKHKDAAVDLAWNVDEHDGSALTGRTLEEIAEVSRALREANQALADSGRIVLRYSGTEPKARVMVEAERAEDVAHWAERIAAAVRSAVGA